MSLYERPKQMKFTPWQLILANFPKEPCCIADIYKLNNHASWIVIRGYLELMETKNLLTITGGPHKKVVTLTLRGQSMSDVLQSIIQQIPVADENKIE